MMKLSKAQQAVVDKMQRQPLSWVKGLCPYAYISTANGPHNIRTKTFEILKKKGVIELAVSNHIFEDYRLTEQYKTANNENSNTGDTTE